MESVGGEGVAQDGSSGTLSSLTATGMVHSRAEQIADSMASLRYRMRWTGPVNEKSGARE